MSLPFLFPPPLRANVLTALLCTGAGLLALLLPHAQGELSMLYPPTGIALAALLVGGYEALPGILLAGAALGFLSQPGTLTEAAWLNGAPLFSALGLGLQALLGRWLMRRLRLWPGALDELRDVLLFCALIAPLASLVFTLFSTPLLLLTAPDELYSQLFDHLLCAWTAATLGLLLCTPLCLALLGQPALNWRNRRRSVAAPLLAGTLVIGLALTLVQQRELAQNRENFMRDAEHMANAVQGRLHAQMDMLGALSRFAAVTPDFSAQTWHDISTDWLDAYPGTTALAWSLPQRQNPASLPIRFAEPATQSVLPYGLDLAGLHPLGEALAQTQGSGRPAVSAPLHTSSHPGRSVVAVAAVLEHEQPGALRGVVAMAVQIDTLLQLAGEQMPGLNLEICLADRSSPPGEQRLYGPPDCAGQDWFGARAHYLRELGFADRQWQIVLRAGAHAPLSHGLALVTLQGTALGVAVMLASFLLLMSGRTRRIEDQVAQRTAELATATAQLHEQKASLAQAQRVARMGSWELLPDSEQLHCSEECRRLLALPESGRLSRDALFDRLLAEDRRILEAAIAEATQAPAHSELDCRILPAGQGEGPQVLHLQIESEWVMGRLLRIHGTAQNVTAAREAEAHIQYLARFDALTGLPNRSYWQELAHAALSAARRHHDRAAVLFLDIDHFKTINDSLGHGIGDRLLAAVAARLKRSLRAEDLLARQGGDEFALLLPRISGPDEISSVAHKLVRSLAAPLLTQGHELSVTVSIGIACYPEDGDNIDALLKHADTAMYSAKQAGRNNFQFFVPEMNARAMQRLQLEHALRRGIERGELVLHYQPQLDLQHARVLGCEALVRWQHPELGMVPPIDFIPLAEECGLILPLGDWVLREACRQQARWAAQGFELIVAINISALQFRQQNFIDHVAETIRETGAQPSHIELEITESALMGSTEALVDALCALRALGVGLALDDFGTGYSCLAYLKRLPIDRLKIDRSFIKDLPGNAEDAAIAAATLSIAANLGMEVVAEGVENEAQREYLARKGCRALQGYLISRPLPARDFETWLIAQQAEPAFS